MPVVVPQTISDIDDPEQTAQQENRRLWWRRAIVMTIVVLLAAPATSFVIWCVRWRFVLVHVVEEVHLGPRDPLLASAYETYLTTEGHARRGPNFVQCALRLNSRLVPGSGMTGVISESMMLFYLGPPDYIAESNASASVVYLYDQAGKKDGVLLISLNGQPGSRTVKTFGWTTTGGIDLSNFKTYAPATQPSSTSSTSR